MEELITLATKEQIILNTIDVPGEYFDGEIMKSSLKS